MAGIKNKEINYLPVLINTTHEYLHFLNKMKWNIPRSGIFDKNHNPFCYQCYKYGLEFYLETQGLGIVKMNYTYTQKQ